MALIETAWRLDGFGLGSFERRTEACASPIPFFATVGGFYGPGLLQTASLRFRDPWAIKELVEVDGMHGRTAQAKNQEDPIGVSLPLTLALPYSCSMSDDPENGPETVGDGRLRDLVLTFEKALIVTALAAAGGNQRRAAEVLGLNATTLFHKIQRLGISESANPRFSRTRRSQGNEP